VTQSLLNGLANWLAPAGVPIAWRQLRYDRNRLIAATAGIAFAVTASLFQTGAYNALFDSIAVQYGAFDADLLIHSANFRDIVVHSLFQRDLLARARADPDVATTEGVTSSVALWRLPDGGIDQVLVFGIDPPGTAFSNPEIMRERRWLALPDTVLWDRLSLPAFGDIDACLASGHACPTEANGALFYYRGVFSLGISFTAQGQAVVSREGFLRMFPDTPESSLSLGLVRLKPGANPIVVRDRLRAIFGRDVAVVTKADFIQDAKDYWGKGTPIGFIIPVTLAVTVLVGIVVFYQILYTDVQHHLSEYATLKAVGYQDRVLQSIVIQQALWLSILGYPPGLFLAFLLFRTAREATHLPFFLSAGQGMIAFCLIFFSCLLAGVLAMRKLRQVAPADLFQ
jgi:putative ABC transport system permease protein